MAKSTQIGSNGNNQMNASSTTLFPPPPEPGHDGGMSAAAATVEASTAVASAAMPGGSPSDDPWDPRNLRLGQDFAGSVAVKKVSLSVPVKKPLKHWFFRVHPDPAYRIETAIHVQTEGLSKDHYLVERHLWPEIPGGVTPSVLLTATNRSNSLFLIPIPLPGSDGKYNKWHSTLLDACTLAESKWVKVVANTDIGEYDIYEAAGTLSEPEWPALSFSQILKAAFKDNFIRNSDHVVLRKLRGEE